MLTGSEPVSAGNLRAIVGSHARKTGLFRSGDCQDVIVPHTSAKRAEAEGADLGGSIVPDVPGVYSVEIEAIANVIRGEGQTGDIDWFACVAFGGCKVDFGTTGKESDRIAAIFSGTLPIGEDGIRLMVCGRATVGWTVNFGHRVDFSNLKISIIEI